MKSMQSYFNAVNSSLYGDKNRWETTQIGRGIETHATDLFPDLKFTEIAVFNVPEYEGSKNSASEFGCKIRELFYSFHYEDMPRIADLGVFQIMPSRKESFRILQNPSEFFKFQ